jgi:diketogulonate reductase-like aldo/keto reductase
VSRRSCSTIDHSTKSEHLETAVRSLEIKLTDEQVKALEAPYQPHRVKGH